MTNQKNVNTTIVLSTEVRTCPRCGLTETLLRTEGLLGCSSCYETFADLVAQAAAALHGVTLSPNVDPVAHAPEILPPPIAPVLRKKLSWLPRRSKPSPSPPAPSPDSAPKAKKGRSSE